MPGQNLIQLTTLENWLQKLTGGDNTLALVLQVFIVVLVVVVANFFLRRTLAKLELRTSLTPSPWDYALVSAARKPLLLLAWIIGISFAARIIQAELDVKREEVASKMGFSAYGVTQSDDPLSQAMRGLIDNAATQEHQIAMLWQALEKLSCQRNESTVVPGDAAVQEHFEADKLNRLMGK